MVEAAYRRLARKYHPDLNPGDEAGALMRQLNEAYAVLKDPARRAAYDRERSRAAERVVEPTKTRERRPAETRRERTRRPEPKVRPAPPPEPPPRAEPPPRFDASATPIRREVRRVTRSFVRNRVVLTTAACVALAAAIFAAFAAQLFAPEERRVVAATSTPGIVVVNRAWPVEPTPTPSVRVTATPEPWPPFPLDRPVPVDQGEEAGAAAVGSFLSRAGQDIQRRLLGGPRAPATPVPPR